MARILIVEDNRDLRELLCELLGADHGIEVASRGDEALEAARRFRPDLVVMDLQLPGMSGVDAGLAIKEELGADVAVLALTAVAYSGSEESVLGSGCCDAYLNKPASLPDLRAKVDELLGRDGGIDGSEAA